MKPRGCSLEPGKSRQGRAWYVLESVSVFAVGMVLMRFIYAGPGGLLEGEAGVPGNDSFYHVKMAAMLPEHGLLETFPWLRFTYFREQGEGFVSHHYGFHALLCPFVKLSHSLTGDYLPGARWAIGTFFGINLMLFNLLLISAGIRWRWLWLFLFILMPFQFFTRHSYVRAIGPSLMFMQLIVLAMFRGRYLLAGITIACYMQVYLGGVIYAPLLVALYALSLAIGPRGDRTMPWRMVALTAGGWVLGLVANPYTASGVWEFLKLQVLGTGLSPDIPVGREWKSYTPAWFFVEMSGPVLVVWTAAVCARFRLGGSLNARELALLLMNFTFLVLTLKSRRFVEYWPVFCLLSAAFLFAPLMNRVAAWFEGLFETKRGDGDGRLLEASVALPLAAAAVALFWRGHAHGVNAFVGSWQLWTAVTALYLLAPLARVWLRTTSASTRVLQSLRIVALGAVAWGATYCFASPQWLQIQRVARCKYDLPEIRRAMSFLEEHSQPGDVVFTDDWDIFPVYFYYNSHNNYIVGLDPKFTQHRRPDLWERYVKVSRGQVPADTSYATYDESGKEIRKHIHARLKDIRDHFGAAFVITDSDHKKLASKLASAKRLAELIYPSTSYKESRDQPYLIFRILGEGEERGEADLTEHEPDRGGTLYLCRLTALSVEQGWGDFMIDRSVGGGPIHLDRTYVHGLGTHAPSKLLYAIPEGYDAFEASVGVGRSNKGKGSIVASIHLDGECAFTTSVLTGASNPVVVRIPLGSAQRLLLQADPTDDGKRFDHVDWADARFVRRQTEPRP